MLARMSLATEPWWASASSSPASSLIAPASRSARRRLLTKIIVERWSRISRTNRGWIAGQMEGPPIGWADAGPGCTRSQGGVSSSSSLVSPTSSLGSGSRAMSSTGTSTFRSKSFLLPASTMVTGRGRPSTAPPR